MSKEPKIRQFSTGANRNSDIGKLDYEGFNSPIVEKAYAEYLNRHRKLSDGTVRDSDNWQKLFGDNHYDVCAKSMLRHVMDVWLFHRGFPEETNSYTEALRFEDQEKPFTEEERIELAREEAICGAIFNLKAYLFKLRTEKRNNAKSQGS